ncbi:MAG: GNAT family N-acetyltransferase [Nitrospirae bacterium]|nr:GNAT family N-acetyltransferase [Nitrospirota bacterium]
MSDFQLNRIEPDTERKPFDCDHNDLKEFFLEDSKNYTRQLLAVTYALESEDKTIAYFSVLNDSIKKGDTTKSRLKKILRTIPFIKRGHKSQPAVKVGRFAVAKTHQRNGIGTDLMNFIKIYFTTKNKTGCRFITVDAYRAAIPFYKKNGFDFLTTADENDDERQMYFDLITFIREKE